MRRTTNEAAPEDLRHLRVGRAGGGLQGRAHAVPVPDRARQDPARAGSRAPAPGTSGSSAPRSSGPGSSRCCPTSRASPAERRRAGGRPGRADAGARCSLLAGFLLLAPPDVPVRRRWPALLLVSRPASAAGVGLAAGARSRWSRLWLDAGRRAGRPVRPRGRRCWCPGRFLALTLWRPSNRISRALAATGGAARGAGGLDVRPAAPAGARSGRRVEIELAALQTGHAGGAERARPARPRCPRRCPRWRTRCPCCTPACSALAAIAGLRLAWAWYHRIADRPVGRATGAVRRTSGSATSWSGAG